MSSLQRAWRGVPVLLALSLTACGTGGARIETTEIPGGDLAARETFAWQGPRLVAQGVEASEQQVQQFDSSIQAGVVDALEAKGFRQAPAGTADFLVTYQFVVSGRSVETRRNPTPPSVSGSVGAGDPLDIMRQSQVAEEQVMRTEGSLIIFATDRETGRILWRGVADQAVVSVGRAVREIPRVVREMMQEFPARAT